MKPGMTVEQLQERVRLLENRVESEVRMFLDATGVPECQLSLRFGEVKYGPLGGKQDSAYTTIASVNL